MMVRVCLRLGIDLVVGVGSDGEFSFDCTLCTEGAYIHIHLFVTHCTQLA